MHDSEKCLVVRAFQGWNQAATVMKLAAKHAARLGHPLIRACLLLQAHASEESSLTGSHGLTGESDDELTTSSAIQTPDPASNGSCRLHSPNATAAAAAAAAVHGSHQPLDSPSAPHVLQMYSSEPPAGPSRADPAPRNISNCDLRRPASKAPHLNNQTSAATRPQKRPRTSACLAVPSGRARMAAGVGEAAEDSDVENADEESPDWYLPSAADQAEAQSESHEDEDGGAVAASDLSSYLCRGSNSMRGVLGGGGGVGGGVGAFIYT